MSARTGSLSCTVKVRRRTNDDLFDNEGAPGLLVKIIEEDVATWLLRLHLDGNLRIRFDDRLELQRVAFEFHRLRSQVFNFEDDSHPSGGLELGRLEFVILHRNLERSAIVGSRQSRCEGARRRSCRDNCYFPHRHFELSLLGLGRPKSTGVSSVYDSVISEVPSHCVYLVQLPNF